MNPERWQQIERIYNHARECGPEQRNAFLTEACGDDHNLRREIESLLDHEGKAGQFMEQPAMEVAAKSMARTRPESLAGRSLNHYRIVSFLGAGGMGEVYVASDTKLNRNVAIKILPEAFARDRQRLARFHREAQLLASLNHPRIAAIYGLEESDGLCGLALELVDGETLAERIARGPVPVDEALGIARQIAEALEAAHAKGVVHRDLKPANIKMTRDGAVKVLDFGLAKIFDSGSPSSDLPTKASLSTEDNVILGTVGYMSPEQARGKDVDKRTDIWAWGCVFYEMLTGKRTFDGDTTADVIVKIVAEEPDWTQLPEDTPASIRNLLRRTLQKDPSRRLHDIADARIEIEDAPTTPVTFTALPIKRSGARERLAWITAAALALALAGLAIAAFRSWQSKEEARVTRFQIPTPADATSDGLGGAPYPAVSPDGRYLAITAIPKGSSIPSLYVRALDSLTAESIPGTEGISGNPFWSPDSHFIGFIAGKKLKKVAISGGPPQPLCDAINGEGGTWSQKDVIVFEEQKGLHKVSAAGGDSTVVLSPSDREGFYRFPAFLPDGQHFLFSAGNKDTGRREIRTASIDGGESTPLLALSNRAAYVAGYLLFVRDGVLMAQSFDAVNLKLTGAMLPITGRVFETMDVSGAGAPFTVSDNGTLIYRSEKPGYQVVWFDRSGKRLTVEPIEGNQSGSTLSPDDTKLAYSRIDSSGVHIWVRDLRRETDTPLTSDHSDKPVWSPDGDKIVFSSNRSGKWELYQKSANGAGVDEPLHVEANAPNQWTSAGILFTTNTIPFHISLLSSHDGKQHALLTGNERHARFSPDGKFLLYTSSESGRGEVFVQTFPLTGRRWQVSVNGGFFPTWRADGKEIFFMTTDNSIMSAEVKPGPKFDTAVPHKLFQLPGNAQDRFPVTQDGQRFLFAVPKDENFKPTLTVVLNWPAGLKK